MDTPAIAIMGILNVTPDSFSDGGLFATLDSAVGQAEQMIADGADIIDIGGESTRPFADPVSTEEELRRVIPVIEAIRRHHSIPISIDTTKASVAKRALDAGATLINDVSALRKDPLMIELVCRTEVPLIIMHMQGTPADMQIRPEYDDVLAEILAFFRERLAWLSAQGVDHNRITIDPGIGFGKTLAHNLSILKHLDRLAVLGRPVLLGHSRKRFLGEVIGIAEERERDQATAIVSALCANKSVSMLRVHDVAATRQALAIVAAMEAAP